MEIVQKLGRRAVGGQKFCHVCSEKADGSNYGGICCRCCKVFFSHAVRNNITVKFKCNCDTGLGCCLCGDEGNGEGQINCVINKDTRRKCKKCRYQKCLQIGMQSDFVYKDCTEYNEARTRIFRNKTHKIHETNSGDDCGDRIEANNMVSLTTEEITKMQNIREYYKAACETILYNYPNRTECETLSKTKAGIMGICGLSTLIRRFVYFVKLLPEFASLSGHDQTILLRECIVQIFLLRMTLCYDAETGMFFTTEANTIEKYPPVHTSEIRLSWPTVDMTIKVLRNLQQLQVDENSVMLLTLIVIFSHMPNLLEENVVNSAQECYTSLLRKYCIVQFGVEHGGKMFPKLLAQLVELRQLADLYEGFPLHLSDIQVNRIHTVLFNLQNSSNSIPQVTNALHNQSEWSDSSLKSKQLPRRGADALTKEGNGLLMSLLVPADNPTFPVQKAFMQRIPHLLQNPLDPLIQEN